MVDHSGQSQGAEGQSADSKSGSRSAAVGRRQYLTVAGTALAGLAGCLGGSEDSPAEGTDDGGPLASTAPSPTGQALSTAEIQRLVDIFDDQPMNDAQLDSPSGEHTPRHVWMWVTDESFIGLQFDDPEPADGTELHYAVVGRKGLFTEQSKPGPEFTHFHQHTADSWAAGRGGEGGEEGYWLTHMAVTDLQYPFHSEPVEPSVDYDFRPTPVPPGNEDGHRTDFDSPSGVEGSITAAERDALLEVFTDKPMNEAQQDSPSGQTQPFHVWKWVTEDVFLILQFGNAEPAQAAELDYFGLGVRGQFSAADQPADTRARADIPDLAPDARHFHKHQAESWAAGHGAQDSSQWGYWLIHHSVRPVEYPWHDEPMDIGLDRQYFPTPL